jgi:2-keto-4-pentenoate hydratase
LGLDRPFWAPMYDKTVMVSRSVSLDSLVAPRIEPEIAVGLRDDLAPGASVEVELRSGTSAVARGRGADVLGGPVEAVRWLMAVPGIEPLGAGSIITTRTLTSAFAVAPGESWELVASGPVPLGSVQVSFSQSAPE